jgi:hypothetical protein
MTMLWVPVAFIAGTFFGVFTIALAQAAARGDRREPGSMRNPLGATSEIPTARPLDGPASGWLYRSTRPPL